MAVAAIMAFQIKRPRDHKRVASFRYHFVLILSEIKGNDEFHSQACIQYTVILRIMRIRSLVVHIRGTASSTYAYFEMSLATLILYFY